MNTADMSGASQSSVGQRLFDKGWRQGVMFQAPGFQFVCTSLDNAEVGQSTLTLRTRPIKEKEWLVVITQDCDITSRNDNAEPYIEVLVCETVNTKFAAKADRNSARYFVIDPATGLTAQMRYRLIIAKEVLLSITPSPWPGDTTRFERFVRWLARRYDRPAVPDALVEVFQQPIEDLLNRLSEIAPDIDAAFSRAIHEIRVNIPSSERPPFDVQMTFLIHHNELADAELDALIAVDEMIHAEVDRSVVTLDETRFLTSEQISMAEYFATRVLFLEYHTYKGDEIQGAKPYPRA